MCYSRLTIKKILERPKLKRHPRSAIAFSSPEHTYKNFEHHGKLTFLGVIVNKHISTKTREKKKNNEIFLTESNMKQKIKLHATTFQSISPLG